MSSSGTKPLSLSEFLFQTKARVRPRAAPSLRILSTRYCPRCPYPTTPILWEEELVAMSCADNLTLPQSCVSPNLKHNDRPTAPGTASIMSAGVKSAPTLLLAAVVLSWNGGQSVLGVVGGLVFSAVGDCCLIWPELFLHGMGAFAVAHLLYSLTFLSGRYSPQSSSSLNRFLYLILFMVGGGFYIYLYPFLQKAPDSDLLIPAVGVYVVLITLMGTLAIRTRHAVTLLGSLSFMVSDMSLALQVFKVTAPMKHGQIIVMVTYYLAQLLIAVGDVKAVENKDDFSKWKRS